MVVSWGVDTGHPTKRRRRWWGTRWRRRWIANPIASLVLLGMLAGDALTLPRGPYPTLAGSIVGSIVPSGRGGVGGLRRSGSGGLYVVGDPDRMRVIDPNRESWDELSRLLSTDETPVAFCTLQDSTPRRGVWSHTVEDHTMGIWVQPMVGEWTEQDISRARQELFSARTQSLPCWVWVRGFEDVADADMTTSRVLWTGVVHDSIALFAAAALLYSFTGWRSWFASRPWSRQHRRIAHGLCPSCGYDLRGLPRPVSCPECGRSA